MPLAATSAYANSLASLMRNAIEQRIGTVTASPPLPTPPVHVVVLDPAPDSPFWAHVTGLNRHGNTMAALIADIAEAPGAAEVSTVLARAGSPRSLRRVDPQRSGGGTGSEQGT